MANPGVSLSPVSSGGERGLEGQCVRPFDILAHTTGPRQPLGSPPGWALGCLQALVSGRRERPSRILSGHKGTHLLKDSAADLLSLYQRVHVSLSSDGPVWAPAWVQPHDPLPDLGDTKQQLYQLQHGASSSTELEHGGGRALGGTVGSVTARPAGAWNQGQIPGQARVPGLGGRLGRDGWHRYCPLSRGPPRGFGKGLRGAQSLLPAPAHTLAAPSPVHGRGRRKASSPSSVLLPQQRCAHL